MTAACVPADNVREASTGIVVVVDVVVNKFSQMLPSYSRSVGVLFSSYS